MTINNLRNNAYRYKTKYTTEATKRIGKLIHRQDQSLEWFKNDAYITSEISNIFSKIESVSYKLYDMSVNPNAGKVEYYSSTIRDALRELAMAKSHSIDLLKLKKDIMEKAEQGIKDKYRDFKIDLINETNRLFEERKSNIEFHECMSNEMIRHGISVWVPNGSLQNGTMISMPLEFSFEKYIDVNITDDDDDGEYIPQKLPEQLAFKVKLHLGVKLDMRGQYVGFKLFDHSLRPFKSFHSSRAGNVCLGDLVINTSSIQDIVRDGDWSKLKNMFEQIRIMFKTIHKENGFHESFQPHEYCGNELLKIDDFIDNGCELEE